MPPWWEEARATVAQSVCPPPPGPQVSPRGKETPQLKGKKADTQDNCDWCCSWLQVKFWSHTVWVQILPLVSASCVTLGKWLNHAASIRSSVRWEKIVQTSQGGWEDLKKSWFPGCLTQREPRVNPGSSPRKQEGWRVYRDPGSGESCLRRWHLTHDENKEQGNRDLGKGNRKCKGLGAWINRNVFRNGWRPV